MGTARGHRQPGHVRVQGGPRADRDRLTFQFMVAAVWQTRRRHRSRPPRPTQQGAGAAASAGHLRVIGGPGSYGVAYLPGYRRLDGDVFRGGEFPTTHPGSARRSRRWRDYGTSSQAAREYRTEAFREWDGPGTVVENLTSERLAPKQSWRKTQMADRGSAQRLDVAVQQPGRWVCHAACRDRMDLFIRRRSVGGARAEMRSSTASGWSSRTRTGSLRPRRSAGAVRCWTCAVTGR